tara:strand:+ start:2124 stop:2375 length:252 start_codon:yes stop_codon:yes gene_type:complete
LWFIEIFSTSQFSSFVQSQLSEMGFTYPRYILNGMPKQSQRPWNSATQKSPEGPLAHQPFIGKREIRFFGRDDMVKHCTVEDS